jgi:hypothetical protein
VGVKKNTKLLWNALSTKAAAAHSTSTPSATGGRSATPSRREWVERSPQARGNQQALLDVERTEIDESLGDFLASHAYGRQFIDDYLVPMGSAIWSASPKQMFDFPSKFFIRFFHNHGMLSVADRPEWRVIQGGSKAYVEKLTAGFKDKIHFIPYQRETCR